jgi:hypothetical protein
MIEREGGGDTDSFVQLQKQGSTARYRKLMRIPTSNEFKACGTQPTTKARSR